MSEFNEGISTRITKKPIPRRSLLRGVVGFIGLAATGALGSLAIKEGLKKPTVPISEKFDKKITIKGGVELRDYPAYPEKSGPPGDGIVIGKTPFEFSLSEGAFIVKAYNRQDNKRPIVFFQIKSGDNTYYIDSRLEGVDFEDRPENITSVKPQSDGTFLESATNKPVSIGVSVAPSFDPIVR